MKTTRTWQVVIRLPGRTSELVISKIGFAQFATQARAKILGVDKVEAGSEKGLVNITVKGERVKRAQYTNETREAFGPQIAHDFDKLIHGIIG